MLELEKRTKEIYYGKQYDESKVQLRSRFRCRSWECTDLTVNITPENPVAYAKVYIKPGFWANSFVIEPSTKEEMPL